MDETEKKGREVLSTVYGNPVEKRSGGVFTCEESVKKRNREKLGD